MPKISDSGEPVEGVQAVALTLKILEALANARSTVGVTELSKQIGAGKARVYRHLQTLVTLGYALKDEESERYSTGPQLLRLSHTLSYRLDVVEAARLPARKLSDATGLTAVVARVEGDAIVVVHAEYSRADTMRSPRIGTTMQFHYTALGKIALAFGPAELRSRVLNEPLEQLTAYTITDRRDLMKKLEKIQELGWASSANEGMVGFNALAAPITDAHERLVGMICVVGSIKQLPATPPQNYLDALLSTADDISAYFGHVSRMPS
ncbi:bacterial transcriptional regulator family protein [Paraburkholderia xenovorans LB400]|nr:IclR family transcriptional regulator [Paraburkholderia xenovorans]AIP34498.1 bacterial transcriptional regulator family protein [Paraburkholderia xenovorans LB400]